MKHKRIHAKIVEELRRSGDMTTGEIQTWVRNLRPTNRRAKGCGHMTGQSINVISNVVRRKPIVQTGFDPTAKQAIWGVPGIE